MYFDYGCSKKRAAASRSNLARFIIKIVKHVNKHSSAPTFSHYIYVHCYYSKYKLQVLKSIISSLYVQIAQKC